MRVILDTCSLIWLCMEPDRLSEHAGQIIDADATQCLISHVSVWEIALKIKSGKMVFPKPLRRWIFEQKEEWELEWIPISLNHLLRTTEMEGYHDDPFDRLLVAQALEENIPIITPDKYITRYPVEVIW